MADFIDLSGEAIGSGEALGSPGAVLKLTVTGIASGEMFGSHELDRIIVPVQIGGGVVFGIPHLIASVIQLITGIPSQEAFGTPTLPDNIHPTSIDSGEAIGYASVGKGINPAGIVSSEAVGSPTLTGPRIIPVDIPSEEAFGTPNINAPVIDVAGQGIASAAVFGTPSLLWTIQPSPIVSREQFGIISIANSFLQPTGIASVEAFGSHSVAFGIKPPAIASAGAIGVPSLGRPIYPTGIPTEEVFGTPKLADGIRPSGIPTEEAFGTPSLARLIRPTGFRSDAVGRPNIARVVNPAGITSAEALGTPRLGTGVRPVGIPTDESFGVGQIDQRILMTGIPSAEKFGRISICVTNYDLRGRQPTTVNASQGMGHDYPLVAPSDDIQLLFSDFYLSYPDQGCQFTYPLFLDWLYGFGCRLNDEIPGFPEPTHRRDLIVVDALGNRVFDSTLAESYVERPWGDRLLICEWHHGDTVCRIVQHTAWPSDGTSTRDYDVFIQPVNSELDSRTYERLPPRVRSLQLGLDRFDHNVQLTDGYNVTLTYAATTRVDGGRFVTRATIDATPGSGQGRSPGCESVEPILRRINTIKPTDSGNFTIDATDCYRIQMPLKINAGPPRTASFFSDTLTPEQAASAIRLDNDCKPCCECDDYARVYKGLRHVWFTWLDVAQHGERVRDLYEKDKVRWLEQYQCRLEHPVKLIGFTEKQCNGQFAGTYCNFSVCCLQETELRFTAQLFDGVTPIPSGTIQATISESFVTGSPWVGREPYAMGGEFPVYKATIPQMDPQSNASVQFRVCTKGCNPNWSLKMTMTAHAPDPLPNDAGVSCPVPVVAVPADVSALWTDSPSPVRGFIQKTIPLNPVARTYPCGDC